MTNIASKVAHVRAAPDSAGHHCHWTGGAKPPEARHVALTATLPPENAFNALAGLFSGLAGRFLRGAPVGSMPIRPKYELRRP